MQFRILLFFAGLLQGRDKCIFKPIRGSIAEVEFYKMIWTSSNKENHDPEPNSSCMNDQHLTPIQICFQRWIPKYLGVFKCESDCLADRLQIPEEFRSQTCMNVFLYCYKNE